MSVGVQSLDSDHQRLLGLLNELDLSIATGTGGEEIASVLDRLTHYVTEHFGREEALMRAVGYPDVDSHIRAHGVLTGQVRDITQRHRTNPEAIRERAVMGFLVSWLTTHIMGRDKLYSPFLGSRPAAIAEAEAAFDCGTDEAEALRQSLAGSETP